MTLSIPELSAVHVVVTGDATLVTPNQSEFEAAKGFAVALENGGQASVLAYGEDWSSSRFVDKQSR